MNLYKVSGREGCDYNFHSIILFTGLDRVYACCLCFLGVSGGNNNVATDHDIATFLVFINNLIAFVSSLSIFKP